MTEKIAFELIRDYIDGWKQNNLNLIVSCLAENCTVIESHGPTYCGISDIEKWFNLWLAAKSKVTKWDILSFNYCDQKETVFVEWEFSCISNGRGYSFPGMSVFKFDSQKISFLHEYRMIRPAFVWKGVELISE